MDVIIISLFIFGLFIGSFYNVVSLRLCKNESIIKPGSHCVNCNHHLSWYELIPVFSYLFLKGRCMVCHQKISMQYPVVEIITGLLFAISYYLYGFNYMTLISIVISSIVIITFVTDAIYMVILDEVLIFGFLVLTIIYFIFEGPFSVLSRFGSAIFIFMIFLTIKFLGDRAFKTESLGWGDVKLSILAGLTLNPVLGTLFLVLASFMAFPYAIYISIRHNEVMLPFGPFLAASMLIVLWNMDMISNFIKILVGV